MTSQPRVVTLGLPWESGDRLCYVGRRDPEPSYSADKERVVHSVHLAIFGRLFHLQADWGTRPRKERP